MTERIEFHRLEDYHKDPRYDGGNKWVICSFETRQLGIYQVKYENMGDLFRLESLEQEPNMNFLTDDERVYIEKICLIVYRMIYDAPAATDRFA